MPDLRNPEHRLRELALAVGALMRRYAGSDPTAHDKLAILSAFQEGFEDDPAGSVRLKLPLKAYPIDATGRVTRNEAPIPDINAKEVLDLTIGSDFISMNRDIPTAAIFDNAFVSPSHVVVGITDDSELGLQTTVKGRTTQRILKSR